MRFIVLALVLFCSLPRVSLLGQPSTDSQDEALVVFRALQRAYPRAIRLLKYDNNKQDWAILVYQKWFYWAEGRILPEELRNQWASYRKLSFYYYPQELPALPSISEAEAQRIMSEQRRGSLEITESDAFRMALYRAYDKDAMDMQIRKINFLGFPVKIHPMIEGPLRKAERQVRQAMLSDPQLVQFLRQNKSISSYLWRKISYFDKLSNHSFGLALDFIPLRWGSRYPYWFWAKPHREDWFNIPYQERWSPPQKLIDIMEANGFVWGGKWLYFDTMHFEYRPELFLLRPYLAQKRREIGG